MSRHLHLRVFGYVLDGPRQCEGKVFRQAWEDNFCQGGPAFQLLRLPDSFNIPSLLGDFRVDIRVGGQLQKLLQLHSGREVCLQAFACCCDRGGFLAAFGGQARILGGNADSDEAARV